MINNKYYSPFNCKIQHQTKTVTSCKRNNEEYNRILFSLK